MPENKSSTKRRSSNGRSSQKSQKSKKKSGSNFSTFLSSAINSFKNTVRSQDAYGSPITLNYKGEDTYKTLPGGLISLVFVFLFTCYCIVKLRIMTGYQSWRITQQVVVAETEELLQPKYFDELKNISMGF
jgi:hypothetical protein